MNLPICVLQFCYSSYKNISYRKGPTSVWHDHSWQHHTQTLVLQMHYQIFPMPYVWHGSYELSLFRLIGCRFEFGFNRFEKEYLRKCAFWQSLKAEMYGAHVSPEIGVRSLGSPLESVPPTPTSSPHLHLHARQNIHVNLPCACDLSVDTDRIVRKN